MCVFFVVDEVCSSFLLIGIETSLLARVFAGRLVGRLDGCLVGGSLIISSFILYFVQISVLCAKLTREFKYENY